MTNEICIVDYPKTQGSPEDIDILLVDRFLEFLFKREILEGENLKELTDKIKKYKISIQNSNRIGISRKQKLGRELVDQIYSTIFSPGLDIGKDYFSLLQKFQEASFRYYQENNRDHLIHSLRVFLLVIAIFNALDYKWISILKDFLRDLLERLDTSLDPDVQLMRLSSGDLWKISIRGASMMSLFHDIGIVPSKYAKLIEGINDTIFGIPDDGGDLSIFSFEFELKLKEDCRKKIENTLPIYGKLFEKFHPEYVELFQKLEEDFEILKKPLKNRDTKAIESIHGSLSLFLLYLFPILKETLSEHSISELKKNYDIATSRPHFSLSNMDTKDDMSISDEFGIKSKRKLTEVVDALILFEATNAIFVHDKENHITLSPFSEILVFADTSQEWDRIQYKKGKMTRYQRDEIEISLHKCRKGEFILSFHEGDQFEGIEKLEKLIKEFRNLLSDMKKKGTFGIFINLVTSRDLVNMKNSSQAIFRCKYHSKLLDYKNPPTRDRIPIESFCRDCAKNTGGK